ncbi:MAG: UDP-glucose 4-epimerase GalE [Paludibacter sp.]|jgi:UDP-glucose 4-epimerase|nr:UDP-glucose 4-epimerase GalE [Paludibacter sp.]
MAKILVTGGTGYIGSHTVVELQNAGFEVFIVDNLSNSDAKVVDRIEKITGIRPAFKNTDCVEYKALEAIFEENNGFNAIINFAASKAVGESVEQPLMYYENNLMILINLLKLMLKYNSNNLVFSSSCTVYGQPEILPVTESAPIQPALSPYGNTKQICEEIIRDTLYANPGLNSVILRYFNPVGAHASAEIGELPNGIPNNLLPFVTQTAMGKRAKLRVFGNDYNTPDGSCIRDYINVVDLAKAHVIAVQRMLENKSKTQVETFNLGTGRGLSVLEIICEFEKVNGVKVPYKIVGRREGDIEQVWADPAFANTELGWKAEASIDETLRTAWAWEKKMNQSSVK